MPRPTWSAAEYAARVGAGDRVALGRAITLVESTRPADRALAAEVLAALPPLPTPTARVGLTGVPGVGKSTLIERLGRHLIEDLNRRVAVLAVDPSSARTGGSILGDKTRMPWLSVQPAAFVRPSPAGTALGGVAFRTRDVITLVEAAGFDTVLVETVGVGQSETAVRSLTDCFVLLLLAGAGDELQGIKKGIMEMADVLAVTKADGPNAPRARRAAREVKNALHLLRPPETGWLPPVLTCSATENDGIGALWATVADYLAHQQTGGGFEQNRRQQRLTALRELVRQELETAFYARPAIASALPELEAAVLAGRLSAAAAAARLLE